VNCGQLGTNAWVPAATWSAPCRLRLVWNGCRGAFCMVPVDSLCAGIRGGVGSYLLSSLRNKADLTVTFDSSSRLSICQPTPSGCRRMQMNSLIINYSYNLFALATAITPEHRACYSLIGPLSHSVFFRKHYLGLLSMNKLRSFPHNEALVPNEKLIIPIDFLKVSPKVHNGITFFRQFLCLTATERAVISQCEEATVSKTEKMFGNYCSAIRLNRQNSVELCKKQRITTRQYQ